MFYPEKMCKVRIIVPKDKKKEVIDKLYELRVLHIRSFKDKEGKGFLHTAQPVKLFEELSRMYLDYTTTFTALKEKLGIDIESIANKQNEITKKKRLEIKDEKDIREIYENIIKIILSLLQDISHKEEEIKVLEARLRKIDTLKALGVKKIEHLTSLKLAEPIIFEARDVERLDKKLDKLIKRGIVLHTKSVEMTLDTSKKSSPTKQVKHVYLVVASRDKGGKEEVLKEIRDYVERLYSLDEFEVIAKDYYVKSGKKDYRECEIKRLYKYILSDILTLKDNIRANIEKIKELVSSNAHKLVKSKKMLIRLIDKHQQVMKFGESKTVFYIEGYVPCKEKEKVLKAIKRVENKAIIEIKEVKDEDAPVYLHYPRVHPKIPSLLTPFKFLLDIYSLPKYNSIDPTLFTTITFPIFYGFMLGDIGYGLVLLLFSLFLAKITKPRSAFNSLAKIMILSSLSSIVFGFIFGEFFGGEVIFGYELHPLIHRTGEILELIIISIMLGVFHVNLGLLIGFFNELKHGHIKHAFLEKFSWILLELSMAYVAVVYFMHTPIITYQIDKWLSAGLLLLSIYMLWKGEGPKGIFEIPGIIGNILSYARLAAIGLSSVALAFVINKFAYPMFHKSWVYWIGGALIFVIGHTFNIILGVIGPFLHSLRLHYVEFFTKFYEQGGEEYKPYGIIEGDKEEEIQKVLVSENKQS